MPKKNETFEFPLEKGPVKVRVYTLYRRKGYRLDVWVDGEKVVDCKQISKFRSQLTEHEAKMKAFSALESHLREIAEIKQRKKLLDDCECLNGTRETNDET